MRTVFPDTPHGKILEMLAGYGVIKATVEFSGEGDSGAINHIEAALISGVEPDRLPVTPEHIEQWNKWPNANTVYSLHDLLEWVADAILEETGYDWYNNDGGWGEIEIEPGSGRLYVDMNLRTVQSEPYPTDYSVEVTTEGV